MKRILATSLFALAIPLFASTQIMQASLGPGTTNRRVKIYVKPTTAVNGNISTFQFNLAIDASIAPVPSLSFVGSPAFGLGWQIDPSYVEDGFRHYQINSASGGTLVLGAGTELEVMQVEFSGGPSVDNFVSLYTLPGGGSTGNALFYCTGAANSEEGQLYYLRAGVNVVNNLSYTGALPSSASLGGVILPINWLSINAVRNNLDAIITWSVSNEEFNHHYELLRSLDGINFISVASIDKKDNNNGVKNYSFTDSNIDRFNTGIIYYRIKQVDLDAKFSYSEIRSVKLRGKTDEIYIYPNPVSLQDYITIASKGSLFNGKYQLTLSDIAGKNILSSQMELNNVTSFRYYVDNKLVAGKYFLKILKADGAAKSVVQFEKL